jgi:hypothetical protein
MAILDPLKVVIKNFPGDKVRETNLKRITSYSAYYVKSKNVVSQICGATFLEHET